MPHPDSPKRSGALDPALLIFGILVLCAALTWVVPPGAFEKVSIDVPGAGTREVVVPGSYERIDTPSRQGIGAVLLAPIRGLIAAADIVAFVLIVGGAFQVLDRTGAIRVGLRRLAAAARRSRMVERLVIPIFMILFSLGGAVFGMAEEVIPFVLIFVPLARSLGYDSVVGVAIPMVGSGAGFAAAFLNPFTVGVAQGIAEVPLFSGIGLRLVLWCLTTSIAIGFVTAYAARVKRDPTKSAVWGVASAEPPLEASSGAEGDVDTDVDGERPLDGAQVAVLATFAVGLVVLVVGVTRFGWYIEEIAALFFGLGVAVGAVGRLRPSEISRAFMEGARALVATAMIVGLARGILVVLQDGLIIDTVLMAFASLVEGAGATGSAWVMFATQTGLNFFVPSGSGQAALTMPIMAPLADLVGVTRQTAVLAYQMGDGFTNLIIPTNPVLIGAISLGGVPWDRWARWILPLQVILFALGLAALAVAVAIGYGAPVAG